MMRELRYWLALKLLFWSIDLMPQPYQYRFRQLILDYFEGRW